MDIQTDDQLLSLKGKLEENSVLQFSVDRAVDERIPFLDVHVDASSGSYVTSVYRKPTDNGKCLNGVSECPERYKDSVIRAYVHRALKHCSTWPLIHQELDRIRSILVSNNYSLTAFDQQVRRQLHKHFSQDQGRSPGHSAGRHEEDQQQAESQQEEEVVEPTEPQQQEQDGQQDGAQQDGEEGRSIHLYYKGCMSTSYKDDEKALRGIIERNCIATRPQDNIKFIIYYKSPKVASMIMKNNLSGDNSDLKATNVVYEFHCPLGDCARRPNSTYLGHTTTSLSRRITMHLQDGAPKLHLHQDHDKKLTRAMMVDNTTIIARCSQRRRLKVLEAVYIRDRDPLINRQQNMRGTLQLHDAQPLAPRV